MVEPLNLKAVAVQRNLTGKAIAAAMDVSEFSVSRWLTRKQPIPDVRKRQLAELLGIDITDLLPPTESKNS